MSEQTWLLIDVPEEYCYNCYSQALLSSLHLPIVLHPAVARLAASSETCLNCRRKQSQKRKRAEWFFRCLDLAVKTFQICMFISTARILFFGQLPFAPGASVFWVTLSILGVCNVALLYLQTTMHVCCLLWLLVLALDSLYHGIYLFSVLSPVADVDTEILNLFTSVFAWMISLSITKLSKIYIRLYFNQTK